MQSKMLKRSLEAPQPLLRATFAVVTLVVILLMGSPCLCDDDDFLPSIHLDDDEPPQQHVPLPPKPKHDEFNRGGDVLPTPSNRRFRTQQSTTTCAATTTQTAKVKPWSSGLTYGIAAAVPNGSAMFFVDEYGDVVLTYMRIAADAPCAQSTSSVVFRDTLHAMGANSSITALELAGSVLYILAAPYVFVVDDVAAAEVSIRKLAGPFSSSGLRSMAVIPNKANVPAGIAFMFVADETAGCLRGIKSTISTTNGLNDVDNLGGCSNPAPIGVTLSKPQGVFTSGKSVYILDSGKLYELTDAGTASLFLDFASTVVGTNPVVWVRKAHNAPSMAVVLVDAGGPSSCPMYKVDIGTKAVTAFADSCKAPRSVTFFQDGTVVGLTDTARLDAEGGSVPEDPLLLFSCTPGNTWTETSASGFGGGVYECFGQPASGGSSGSYPPLPPMGPSGSVSGSRDPQREKEDGDDDTNTKIILGSVVGVVVVLLVVAVVVLLVGLRKNNGKRRGGRGGSLDSSYDDYDDTERRRRRGRQEEMSGSPKTSDPLPGAVASPNASQSPATVPDTIRAAVSPAEGMAEAEPQQSPSLTQRDILLSLMTRPSTTTRSTLLKGDEGLGGRQDTGTIEPGSLMSMGSVPLFEGSYVEERQLIRNVEYSKVKLLGRGAYGSVFSCLLSNGKTVAMKEMMLSPEDFQMITSDVEREIDVMRQIHHPNVIQYISARADAKAGSITLFMELVTGGSLGSMARSIPEPLPEIVVRRLIRQSVIGLAFIHSKGIIHRDIKGDNMLLTAEGVVKLADFGTAKSLAPGATRGAQTMIGTPFYMAPELLNEGDDGEVGYGMKADVWSLGVTVGELLNKGAPPWPSFSNPGQAFLYIAGEGHVPTLPEHVSDMGKDFVLTCCCRDAKERPSCAQLLDHPWLQESGDD